jgi:hypothetical protein
LIAKLIERFLDKVLRDAFPGVEPVTFVYGCHTLGPLRTELLGLKRNHARDEIRLNHLHESWHVTKYYFLGYEPKPYPHSIVKLEMKQRRRAQRMGEIEAKLKRDSRMGKCQ